MDYPLDFTLLAIMDGGRRRGNWSFCHRAQIMKLRRRAFRLRCKRRVEFHYKLTDIKLKIVTVHHVETVGRRPMKWTSMTAVLWPDGKLDDWLTVDWQLNCVFRCVTTEKNDSVTETRSRPMWGTPMSRTRRVQRRVTNWVLTSDYWRILLLIVRVDVPTHPRTTNTAPPHGIGQSLSLPRRRRPDDTRPFRTSDGRHERRQNASVIFHCRRKTNARSVLRKIETKILGEKKKP